MKPNSVDCGLTFHPHSEAAGESRTQGLLVYAETTTGEEPGFLGKQNSSGLRGAVGQEVEAEVEKLRVHDMMAPRESEEVPKMFLL